MKGLEEYALRFKEMYFKEIYFLRKMQNDYNFEIKLNEKQLFKKAVTVINDSYNKFVRPI